MTMKKKILSVAVLAALGAGTAQAVNISTNGLGQVMVAPYYTVQGDEETLLSIVNTTGETKAVKVRFREAYNSREVLDFNLYLSPHDVWVAKIQDDGEGGAEIVTPDNSCTVPEVGLSGEPFRTTLFDGSYSSPASQAQDGGPTDISRVKEGYFEIIEMGVAIESAMIGTDYIWDMNGNGITDSTHDPDGMPDYCKGLRANWDGGFWSGNANAGVSPPTGGLFAAAAVINVQTGTEYGQPMTVLEDFSNRSMHTDPGFLTPSLGEVNPFTSVAIINDPNASNIATFYVDQWQVGIDAVSAVLMAERVINEYTVNPQTDAETDWVVTFPTKWAYADWSSRAPFTSQFNQVIDAEGNMLGMACEPMVKTYFDREERFPEGDIDFSPLPPGGKFELCYEANVVTFGDSNALSAENTVKNFTLEDDDYVGGWASIGMYDPSASSPHILRNVISGNVYQGLPVIGFKATKLGNANVGIGAAYAVSEPHKYARVVSGSGTAAY